MRRVVLLLIVWCFACSRSDLNGRDPGDSSGDEDGDSAHEDDAPHLEHAGWVDVRAVGPLSSSPGIYLTEAGAKTGVLAETDMQVRIAWGAFTGNVTVEGYAVYRATELGALANAPVFASRAADETELTDTQVTPGTIVFYSVRPVVAGALFEVDAPLPPIRVVVPPDNMALVHRWIANREVCGLMNRATDPANNYRCVYTDLGSSSGFYDLGADLLIDRLEAGCNYSLAACAGAACVGATDPAAAAADGSVYYQTSGRCWARTAGTWKQVGGSAAAPELDYIAQGTMAAGMPPLVFVRQDVAAQACALQNVSVAGASIAKSLPTVRQWRAAAAWSTALDDATIAATEEGGEGNCNTDAAHGHSVGTTPDTTNVFTGYVRTASQLTAQCESRYGARDMVGNVWEWAADQCAFTGMQCGAPALPLAADRGDVWTYVSPPVPGSPPELSTVAYFLPTLGLPSTTERDGSIDLAVQGSTFLHRDYFVPNYNTSATRGFLLGGYQGLNGGSGNYPYNNGRWATDWFEAPTATYILAGFRCAAIVL